MGAKQGHASISYGTQHSLSKLSCDGTEKVLYNTGVDLTLDTDALQIATNPKQAGKAIARDGIALYSAAEGVVETFQANGKDEKGQRKLGTRGVLKGLQYSLEDAAGLHATAKDPATCAVINDATERQRGTYPSPQRAEMLRYAQQDKNQYPLAFRAQRGIPQAPIKQNPAASRKAWIAVFVTA